MSKLRRLFDSGLIHRYVLGICDARERRMMTRILDDDSRVQEMTRAVHDGICRCARENLSAKKYMPIVGIDGKDGVGRTEPEA
jgi:anti-sigma-K factor RskA